MRASIIVAVTLATGLWSAAAAADGTPDAVKKDGVWVFRETKIALRPPRPAVVVDVARAVPRAPLQELRQPLIDRIAKAVERAPF
jgi:hypothetical protein